MNNRIAITLGVLVLLGIVVDIVFFGDEHIVFLGKKFMDLIEWIAFWR